MKTYDAAAIIEAHPVPDYLVALGYELKRQGKNTVALCPLHAEKTPSFHVRQYDAHCFGCGFHGDVIALDAELHGEKPRGEGFLNACRRLAGDPIEDNQKRRRPKPRPVLEVEPATQPIEWPGDLHSPTGKEIREIAHSRRVSIDAIIRAIELGTVLAGTVGDSPSWILSDRTERAAEARRIDGRLYYGKEGFKSYALEESRKDWPVGIDTLVDDNRFSRLLIVEGGTDYLAALHAIEEHDLDDVLPVAILGQGTTRTHPDALASFKGRRVRVVPDVDKPTEPGKGEQWAAAWIRLALDAGADSADFFRLDGLTRFDGKPATDLNDAILADAPDVISALLNF